MDEPSKAPQRLGPGGQHVIQCSDSLQCDRTEAVSGCTEDDAAVEMAAEGRRDEWTHQCAVYTPPAVT